MMQMQEQHTMEQEMHAQSRLSFLALLAAYIYLRTTSAGRTARSATSPNLFSSHLNRLFVASGKSKMLQEAEERLQSLRQEVELMESQHGKMAERDQVFEVRYALCSSWKKQ